MTKPRDTNGKYCGVDSEIVDHQYSGDVWIVGKRWGLYALKAFIIGLICLVLFGVAKRPWVGQLLSTESFSRSAQLVDSWICPLKRVDMCDIAAELAKALEKLSPQADEMMFSDPKAFSKKNPTSFYKVLSGFFPECPLSTYRSSTTSVNSDGVNGGDGTSKAKADGVNTTEVTGLKDTKATDTVPGWWP